MSRFHVAIASDHAGFALKDRVRKWLEEGGHIVKDLGPSNADRVDYPDFAHAVAKQVADNACQRGVLICGSGIGMSIAANRTPGARAANCTLTYQAEMTRRHNDAYILCIGERVVGPGLAEELVKVFMETDFDGGRHENRVKKIEPRQ
jgi:ribose 5-phosphate isomerase B